MMKKFCFLLLAILFLMLTASAEIDIHGMTNEELYALRTEINNEIAARAQYEYMLTEGKTIAEIFPDPWLAKYIRDAVGAFSTKDVISQEELDKIDRVWISGQTSENVQVTSLEGIQYLRNLETLYVGKQENISEIPDWIGNLVNLSDLTFRICPINELPDSICNLVNLRSLSLDSTGITALPENIGNLTKLKELDISNTKITKVPESIYGLELDTFTRRGLDLD